MVAAGEVRNRLHDYLSGSDGYAGSGFKRAERMNSGGR